MKRRELGKLLKQLGLGDPGTIFFRNKENKFEVPLHFDTQKKLELIKPDAIYVFNKQPFILFFDLTDPVESERENDVHKKVWSFDNSPVIFVIKNKDIHVYNAFNYIKKYNQLEKIKLSDEEVTQKFSFWNLQSGFTWKWLQEEYIQRREKKETQKRVNERLFQNIKDVRKNLMELNLPESHTNSLILRLIFIRYLIDRKVEINKDYISGKTINDRRKCFCELITRPKKLNELFKYLNDRFNGILFKNLSVSINEEQSEFLAGVFSGELQGKDSLFEGFFFEIFDFSIIPVELISGIYGSLIDDKIKKIDSAVYTPAFLAEYILNDTIDKHLEKSQTSDCKIFEVAVGSGIFLVQSLRRMIEKEIELNGNANKKKFSEKIRNIAKENLFGIDINEEALKVTCFSIYIALLDYQEPKDIEEYEFPTLFDKKDLSNSNLYLANFFDTEHPYNKIIISKEPDFILGNPPWKKDKSKEHLRWVNERNIYSKKKYGGIEIAQNFLLRVRDFMQTNTQVALIVTSTIFYNVSSTTKTFKKKFLTTYCLDKFFDLSPVRHLIFEEKDSPASIVYFRLPKNKDEHLENIVNHQSVKSNYFLKYFKMLVIEKFDQKEIRQKYFIENYWMFKVALYGNILDYHLLKKVMANKYSLGNIIDNKNILIKGSGIKEKPMVKNFPFLLGLKLLKNEEITQYYTSKKNGKKMASSDILLQSGRRKKLFEGNQILLKAQTEEESDIVVSYTEAPFVFKHDIFGICTTTKDVLLGIYSLLVSNLYTYFQFITNCAWGIATRPAIRLEEFLSFPYASFDNDKKTELIRLVDQFLLAFEEHYKQEPHSENLPINQKILSKINSMINDLYEIKGYEKDLIDYVLNVSRYQFQENKQDLLSFTNEEKDYRYKESVLKRYADVYIQEFEKIYTDEFLQVEIYPLEHFIAMKFIFQKEKPTEKISYCKDKEDVPKILLRLANNLSVSQITNTTDPTKNLFIQKDIRNFEENSFYIIKPNEYKCWHRAMAWYDVAEFKEKIEGAELKWLK